MQARATRAAAEGEERATLGMSLPAANGIVHPIAS